MAVNVKHTNHAVTDAKVAETGSPAAKDSGRGWAGVTLILSDGNVTAAKVADMASETLETEDDVDGLE